MADGTVRLSKHHGAGNDFLVLIDPGGKVALSPGEVRALCDRHRGLGADGLVRGTTGTTPGTLAMELSNADGGTAEMSGNGIRCLVQAAVRAGLVEPGAVEVQTEAGLRTVRYRHAGAPGLGHATVDMGVAVVGEALPAPDVPGASAARRVDVGNPHLVVLVTGVGPDVVSEAGARLGRSVPGGTNVEFAWPGPGEGELTMRVWERGVGPTEACGTGACAAAAAAHAWGLVGSHVPVHDLGGTLEVTVTDDGVELAGPTQWVADVELDLAVLARLGEEAAALRPQQPGRRDHAEVPARP